MEYKKAEIVVRKETGQPKTLPEVAFTFNQNRPSLSQNIAAYKPGTDGHCWLGIETEPFEGWAQATVIDFSHPNDGHGVFSVAGIPTQEGGWLWFPVLGTGPVTTYTDRS